MQLHRKGNLYNARWSPDGKWLLFQTDIATPGAGDILGIRPGMDTAPVPVVATPFTEMSPAFSPNGRWLAYASRSEEHTSELQSQSNLVCRLLLEKKKK